MPAMWPRSSIVSSPLVRWVGCALGGVFLLLLVRLAGIGNAADESAGLPEIALLSAKVDLGDVITPSNSRPIVTFVNKSSQRHRVIGAAASCGCISFEGIPGELPPGGRLNVPVFVKHSPVRTTTDFRYRVFFYTDDLQQRPLVAVVVGRGLCKEREVSGGVSVFAVPDTRLKRRQ